MRHQPVLLACLLVMLISLLVDRSPASAAPAAPSLNPPVTGAGWQKITVDSAGSEGQSLSLAINPLTQKPYISYYDGTNGDLKLAFPVASGGDCGPGNTWSCNSLKYTNTADFGLFSSIDFNSAGNWGISYVQTSPSPSVNFEGTPLPGNTQFFISVEGTHASYMGTSFRFSPGGVGSFLFVSYSGGKSYLNYASYDSQYGGTCGPSNNHWDCEIISQTYLTGFWQHPSLAYIGYMPAIAYRDSTSGQLYFAARINTGSGNCTFSNLWQCDAIDINSTAAGGIAFLGDPQYPAVAYYDANTQYLMLADGHKGPCNWTCIYIEDVGAQVNDNNDIALAMRNGKYLIAYTYRVSPSNTILKVAYPDPNGNCGPFAAGGNQTWRCEVVDDGGVTKNVGKFLSMGVTSSNVVYIAYSNDTDQTLKLAYLYNNLFIPLVKK